MKIKKRKKSSRMHGRNMGTHGGGARDRRKKSGSRGGMGMAGSGKRADQKKTLVLALYGNRYFGKQGVTSRKTQKDKSDRINLRQISENIHSYGKRTGDKWKVNLKGYKILGDGDVNEKLIINAESASQSAIDKVGKAGGEIILHSKNPVK